MIKISREERDYLVQNGFKFGNDIHATVGTGKKRTYYATESNKVLNCLKKFRKV